ncbi:MAG: hypothetical protein ACTSV2_09830 [Candidatus Thorarchaeota archaeon]
MVNLEPNRLICVYIAENLEHHTKWHRWRSETVHEGLIVLQAAAHETDEAAEREEPLRLTV